MEFFKKIRYIFAISKCCYHKTTPIYQKKKKRWVYKCKRCNAFCAVEYNIPTFLNKIFNIKSW